MSSPNREIIFGHLNRQLSHLRDLHHILLFEIPCISWLLWTQYHTLYNIHSSRFSYISSWGARGCRALSLCQRSFLLLFYYLVLVLVSFLVLQVTVPVTHHHIRPLRPPLLHLHHHQLEFGLSYIGPLHIHLRFRDYCRLILRRFHLHHLLRPPPSHPRNIAPRMSYP